MHTIKITVEDDKTDVVINPPIPFMEESMRDFRKLMAMGEEIVRKYGKKEAKS